MKNRNLTWVFAILILLTLVFTGTGAGVTYGESVEITPDDGGDDQSPLAIEYDNSLYVVYISTNPDITTGTDMDIVMKSYDGETWESSVEVSSIDNDGGDSSPSSAVFDGKLYVAWATNDGGESTGDDWDIVIRCYDGSGWGDVAEVTDAEDTGDDYSPQLCVFSGKLYLAWQSWDNSTSDGDDADIVLKYLDGNTWSLAPRPTVGDEGSDHSPRLKVFGNEMYLVWSTDDKVANGSDIDIVIRSFDGSQWNPAVELTPAADTDDDQHPYMCLFDDKLYVVWQTSDDATGTGKDDDIVLRWFDGTAWSDILELTSSEILGHKDTGSDAYPILAAFDGQLHALWQTNDPVTSSGSDWDIVACGYNGDKWGKMTELTPSGDSGRDGGVYSRGLETGIYGDRMHIFWQTTDTLSSTGGDLDIVTRNCEMDAETDPENGDAIDHESDDSQIAFLIAVCVLVSILMVFLIKKRPKGGE
ncbi:MAG: hypothetical protein KAS67_01140 [Thermoplasmata archaeon]|nr:hypothetical protein [Thermoplasmata archaeon]